MVLTSREQINFNDLQYGPGMFILADLGQALNGKSCISKTITKYSIPNLIRLKIP